MIYLSSRHNKEAKAILDDSLLNLIREDFSSLLEMPTPREPLCFEVTGESGHEYQVEVTACVDEENEGTLIVMGMIADGYLSSYICLPPFMKSLSVSKSGDILDEAEPE